MTAPDAPAAAPSSTAIHKPSESTTVPPLRLSLALFLLSLATVLFTLSVWKLLSFFIMPSLFFDLLFIGFPVGAFIGVKFFRLTQRSFLKTLWILQAVMIGSVIACLACKNFDYLRAHLFEVQLSKLVGQMAIFTGFFIPFFCSYGLSEYVGYQIGRGTLHRRMRLVYALYLFGAASAYLLVELVLHRALFSGQIGYLGVSHMLVLSVALVAAATALLGLARWQRLVFAAQAIGLSALLFYPGLEPFFLDLYKGASAQSTKAYVEAGHRSSYQRWGHYSLTEILTAPSGKDHTGFYNDLMQWEYAQGTGFNERMLGAIPLNHTRKLKPDARIAIVGAGGGRQVQWATQPGFEFSEIVALELEPAVFGAVRDTLKNEFDHVYEAPNVTPELTEARGYMERTEQKFDLIFMPSVGGYPQMMLEPGNMIRTIDAYKTLRERLTDSGILAVWYPAGLDPEMVLTRQYVRTLGKFSRGLGMRTQAYRTGGKALSEYLILAAKNESTPLPTVAEIDAFLRDPKASGAFSLPPIPTATTEPLFILEDPGSKPITDEQPFLAGNVQHIFSLDQVYKLFSMAVSFFLVTAVVALFGLRKTGDPGIPGRSYWQVAGLAFLLGANFILFEHYLVLALFKKLYIYHEALVLGAISFLILSGLGSIIITDRTRSFFLVVAAVLLGVLLVFQASLNPLAVIACVAPVAFVTGSLFPALFELAARNPIIVFAMDAIGAAIGSMLSFFIPIAFGFSTYFPIAASVFFLTALCTWLFYRGRLQNTPNAPEAA